MNAVTARFGTDVDDGVTKAGRSGVKNLVLIRNANGHRVHKDVAIISGVEIGFAAYRGYAYAIAIATNAGNHALHQMLHLGMVWPSETQCVHIRHWPRAHGEHIAQDAANARCCTLIGFDIGWMVVRFHFEDRGKLAAVRTFANVDDARIFARTADHPRGLSRQFLQMDA